MASKRKFATVYCDASYFKIEKTGAWAVIIKSDYGNVEESGMCPFTCDNITECEVFAAGMALVLLQERLPMVKTIKICSDSSFVTENLIKGSSYSSKNDGVNYHVKMFRQYAYINNNFYITFNHVKSHDNNIANKIVDERAVRTNKKYNYDRKKNKAD